jgi:uncharacterized protein YlxW (UPF0749 family)
MDWIKEVARLFDEANQLQTRVSDLGNRLNEVRNRISTSLGAELPVAPGDLEELKVLVDRVSQAQSQSLDLSGQGLTILNSHLPPKK